MSEFDYGTGRRKNATARTRLYAGNGAIEVNGRKVEDYFPRKTLQMIIRQPLVLTKLVDKFDVKVNVCGCLLYTSPSPRDGLLSRMPSSA